MDVEKDHGSAARRIEANVGGRRTGLAAGLKPDIARPYPWPGSRRSLHSRPPDPHIQRALSAMADMGFLKADHQRPEFRQAEPLRHLAAQHPAFVFRSDSALAGDDQHEGQAAAVGALQEAEQGM